MANVAARPTSARSPAVAETPSIPAPVAEKLGLLRRKLLGWLIVDGLAQAPALPIPGVRAVTPLAPGRFAIEALPAEDPMRVARTLAGTSGRLVSINPVHETLEDLFVRQVDQAAGTERFVGEPAAAGAAGEGRA